MTRVSVQYLKIASQFKKNLPKTKFYVKKISWILLSEGLNQTVDSSGAKWRELWIFWIVQIVALNSLITFVDFPTKVCVTSN